MSGDFWSSRARRRQDDDTPARRGLRTPFIDGYYAGRRTLGMLQRFFAVVRRSAHPATGPVHRYRGKPADRDIVLRGLRLSVWLFGLLALIGLFWGAGTLLIGDHWLRGVVGLVSGVLSLFLMTVRMWECARIESGSICSYRQWWFGGCRTDSHE